MEHQIVVVDDDADLTELLDHAFSSRGFDVKVLSDGKSAWKYLFDEKGYLQTDLLILDRILPDRDGMDILHEWRKIGDKAPPVLVLSVLSSEKEVLSGLKHGALDYIPKPFNLQILVNKALSLLKRG